MTLDLKRSASDSSRGKIILSIDVVKDSNTEVHLRFSGRGIAGHTSCFCMTSTNPFFEVYRGSYADPRHFLKVYDSDPILNNPNP